MSEEESAAGSSGIGARLRDRYHQLALGLVVGFMLVTRMQPYDTFVREDRVYFAGNDPYYHFREISYTVRHWPQTMPFDPWTQFPLGTSTGQFGTLFDQAIATVALIIGLGAPSDRLVAEVAVAAPAVIGALVALPVYSLAKRVTDRRGGIVAAGLLALFPGSILYRGLAGVTDHHIAEVLLQVTALLAVVVALQVAGRERPVLEQALDRDWDGLRKPVVWSALAGIALAVYTHTWPPGIVLVGILAVFFPIAAVAEHAHGKSTEPVAFVGAIGAVSFGVILALSTPLRGFTPTSLSLLHVGLSGLLLVECLGLAALERVIDRRSLPDSYYPTAVAASALLGAVLIWVLAPNLFSAIQGNTMRVIGLGNVGQSETISEAQSAPLGDLDRLRGQFRGQYGLAYLTAIAGLGIAFGRSVWDREQGPECLLIAVWTVFITLMALTQVRFFYYLAPVVAISSAIFVVATIDWIDPPAIDEVADIEVYQVLTLTVLIMLLVFPLTPVMSPQRGSTVFNGAAQTGPGAVTTWTQGLEWMEDGTPSPEGNGFEYYGTYEKTSDFEYPEQAYGVMSWWDYGHWITVVGERIPVANPFQQNPRVASAFFQASSERRASAILDALPASTNLHRKNTTQLEALAASRTEQEAGEDVRYVMIDDQMAGGKFSAITQWAGPGTQEYFERTRYSMGGQNRTVVTTSQRYDNTMLSQLYYEDATELEHYRLVHEVDRYAILGGYAQVRPGRQRVAQRPLRSFPLRGEWNRSGPNSPKNVSRTVDRARGRPINFGRSTYLYGAEVESRVKTFERVRGATITGEVEPNTTVQAALPLTVTNTGRQFTYLRSTEADAAGNFRITVPYPTDAGLGPEDGGTNETVTASGTWRIFTGSLFNPQTRGNATITERQVIEGGTVEVDLSPVEADNETTTNESASNETTDSTSGSGEPDGSGAAENTATPTPTPTPSGAKTTETAS